MKCLGALFNIPAAPPPPNHKSIRKIVTEQTLDNDAVILKWDTSSNRCKVMNVVLRGGQFTIAIKLDKIEIEYNNQYKWGHF